MVGRIGPARAAESCRGALEMGWRDCWRPSRATHNSLPHPQIRRFRPTLRGHNSGPFGGYDLRLHAPCVPCMCLRARCSPRTRARWRSAGGRKRRAEPEDEEERAAAMKSPRGDDNDEGLDDEIEEIDDMDDEEMGQD